MPKVSKNSKKNIRNLRRKMIGGGLNLSPDNLRKINEIISAPKFQELVKSRYEMPKGIEEIWVKIQEINSEQRKKYSLYYDENLPSFGGNSHALEVGLAIIWDTERFGKFLAGSATGYDDAGRGLLFMVTEKDKDHYLFISSQNANNGNLALDGYPKQKEVLERKTKKFLTAVKDKLGEGKSLNLQNVIFTGDLNDKFGNMLLNEISFTDGTQEFKLKHIKDKLVKPTSCCPNWDSLGPSLKYNSAKDYFDEESILGITTLLTPIQDTLPNTIEATIQKIFTSFNDQKQVDGESFKGDLRTGELKPCAGPGFRFELPDNTQQNYIFYGDYAYFLKPGVNVFDNSNNEKMLATPYLNYPKARAEGRSVASDHELVSSTNKNISDEEITIGSYNMSFASDLGTIPNKNIGDGILGKLRQESETAFLIPLAKDMQEGKPVDSRSYYRNAVDNLVHFIKDKSPQAVGLQEVNCWKNYSYLNKSLTKNIHLLNNDINEVINDYSVNNINFGLRHFDSDTHIFNNPTSVPIRHISDIKGASTNSFFTSDIEWLIYADYDFRGNHHVVPLLPLLGLDDNLKQGYTLIDKDEAIKKVEGKDVTKGQQEADQWNQTDAKETFSQLKLLLNPSLPTPAPIPATPSPAGPSCSGTPVNLLDVGNYMKEIMENGYKFSSEVQDTLKRINVCVDKSTGRISKLPKSSNAGGKKSHRRSSVAHKKSTTSHKSAVAKLFQASTKNRSKIPAKKSLKMVKVRSRR